MNCKFFNKNITLREMTPMMKMSNPTWMTWIRKKKSNLRRKMNDLFMI
jgi:hypothetical protein